MAEEELQFEETTDFAVLPKLFGKWEYKDIKASENALDHYLSVKSTKAQVYYPYSAGKYQKKRFQKVNCPITERFVNQLMVGKSTQNGKKQMAVRTFKQSLEIIHLLTDKNPLDVLFEAIVQGGAREDSTRLSSSCARDPERLPSDPTRA